MSRHFTTKATKATIATIASIHMIIRLLNKATNNRAILHSERCLTTLFTTMWTHYQRLPKALQRECIALEIECTRVYNRSCAHVKLVNDLNFCLSAVKVIYEQEPLRAIIDEFYDILSFAENNGVINDDIHGIVKDFERIVSDVHSCFHYKTCSCRVCAEYEIDVQLSEQLYREMCRY